MGGERSIEEEWRERVGVAFLTCQGREELTDLEVVCRDGRLAAHGMVLAAFSPFLRRLLEGWGGEEWRGAPFPPPARGGGGGGAGVGAVYI